MLDCFLRIVRIESPKCTRHKKRRRLNMNRNGDWASTALLGAIKPILGMIQYTPLHHRASVTFGSVKPPFIHRIARGLNFGGRDSGATARYENQTREVFCDFSDD